MLSHISRATAWDAQRIGGTRRRQLAHLVVVRMKRERNERLEAAGFILERTCAHHVVDALLHRLDVTVEHGHVGAQSEPVRNSMDGQVSIRVALVVTDLPPHTFRENLGAAAGQ
jgi:hypothetical protein